MKSSSQDLKHSQKLLTVKVGAGEFNEFFERALKKISRNLKVDGFRPGRAPEAVVIEKVGRETVDAEALDLCLSDTYLLALKEHEVNPVAYPEIDVKKMTNAREGLPEDEVVLEYTATVTVLPDVKVKDLKGIKASPPTVVPPTDEEVDEVVKTLRRQKALTKDAAADQAAEKGNLAVIEYQGSLNGIPQEEMKSQGHPLILGEGNLIPGFEDNLLGLKAGDKAEFDITFPKDYGKKEYAGQKAHFSVTLKELKEMVLPELDEVLSKDFGFDTPEALIEAIRENLGQEKKNEAEQKLQEEILKQLEKRVVADLPEKLIEQEITGMVDDLKKRTTDQGMEWNNYLQALKRSEEELRKEMRPQAERNIRLGLALGYIVKEQKLEVPSEQLAAATALEWLRSQATGEPMRPLDAHQHHDHDHEGHDHDHHNH